MTNKCFCIAESRKSYLLSPLIILMLSLLTLLILNQWSTTSSIQAAGMTAQGSITNALTELEEASADLRNYAVLNVYNYSRTIRTEQELTAILQGINATLLEFRSNDFLINISIPQSRITSHNINITVGELNATRTIHYPLASLIQAYNSFNPAVIQNCISSHPCSCDYYYDAMSACLTTHEGFRLWNDSIPSCIGGLIITSLVLSSNNNITLLYPYSLGIFQFQCS